MIASPRFKPLYHQYPVRGTRGLQRHLFRAAGVGIGSVCGDVQAPTVGRPDPSPRPPACPECWLVALTELALALDALGLPALAIDIAAETHRRSYETPQTQSA